MEITKIENNLLDNDTSRDIKELEKQLSFLKEKEKEVKATLLEKMEKNNIKKIDNEFLTITYIAATEKEIFDTTKFREEHSDLYDEYVKFSPVKASIRIKVKDEHMGD